MENNKIFLEVGTLIARHPDAVELGLDTRQLNAFWESGLLVGRIDGQILVLEEGSLLDLLGYLKATLNFCPTSAF